MSGESNVVFWLQRRGVEPRPELVKAIFEAAKKSDRLLTEAEIQALIGRASERTAV